MYSPCTTVDNSQWWHDIFFPCLSCANFIPRCTAVLYHYVTSSNRFCCSVSILPMVFHCLPLIFYCLHSSWHHNKMLKSVDYEDVNKCLEWSWCTYVSSVDSKITISNSTIEPFNLICEWFHADIIRVKSREKKPRKLHAHLSGR